MSGMTNYLRNLIIDAAFRGQASRQVTFPATWYLRLCTDAPTAGTPATEITGTGYSPLAITPSAANFAATNGDGSVVTPSSGTSGVSSNNILLEFTSAAPAVWDDIGYWELWDAASGGNRWFFGTIVNGSGVPAPRSVAAGDPVQFPISQFRVGLL